jgi:hypothetical protein
VRLILSTGTKYLQAVAKNRGGNRATRCAKTEFARGPVRVPHRAFRSKPTDGEIGFSKIHPRRIRHWPFRPSGRSFLRTRDRWPRSIRFPLPRCHVVTLSPSRETYDPHQGARFRRAQFIATSWQRFANAPLDHSDRYLAPWKPKRLTSTKPGPFQSPVTSHQPPVTSRQPPATPPLSPSVLFVIFEKTRHFFTTRVQEGSLNPGPAGRIRLDSLVSLVMLEVRRLSSHSVFSEQHRPECGRLEIAI